MGKKGKEPEGKERDIGNGQLRRVTTGRRGGGPQEKVRRGHRRGRILGLD